jgi:hypothetical protein
MVTAEIPTNHNREIDGADCLTVLSVAFYVWSASIKTMDENGHASAASRFLRTLIS